MNRKLFTVGPVNVEPEVLEAMTRPMITHRSKEYKQLHGSIVEKVRKALDTDMDVFMVGGSASSMIEGAIRNGISHKSLGITGGSFGDRSIEIAELNGKIVKKVEVPFGKGILPEHIEGKIAYDIEAVHWVSNESSTGVFSDSTTLADEVRRQSSDALVMIDAVTSAFAMDLDMRKLQPDALVFGTQKALALPPGLGMMVCSERLLQKATAVNDRGFYTDLLKIKKQNDVDYALTTPPVSLMYALELQMERILKEGMPARYRRHKEMADMVRTWSEKLYGMFPDEDVRSNTISVLNRGDMDFDGFHTALKSKGYEISNGYGGIKDETFRIGHMGDLTPVRVRELLDVMDEIIEERR
ncbi:MAG TPA: aminotransferase class V-fold PLP-dependent enzyme [Candidatus Methanomethylophilaceae archaeon]|nr:aminotransferase class V-fold PLP-dependent enzyme [Candidatus Methanomethylophilaceae archaeon]